MTTDNLILPDDVEIFYISEQECTESEREMQRNRIPHDDPEAPPTVPGWYFWSCLPGCLPESCPYGPYETAEEAKAEALEMWGEKEEEYQVGW